MQINNESDFFKALDNGPYAWPGGYPCFFLMADGASLSFEAAEENKSLIMWAFADALRPWKQGRYEGEWLPQYVVINYEDTTLHCAHTGKRIPAAYGDAD